MHAPHVRTFTRRAMVVAGAAMLTACVQPPKPAVSANGEDAWSGRLGLLVEGGAQQSFSAGFELSGDEHKGKITLFNPLGNVLARLDWAPGVAHMNTPDQQLESDSLSALIIQLTGNDLPIPALFGWLRGIDVKVTGWEADLSSLDSGKLIATRYSPQPQATLRIVLSR